MKKLIRWGIIGITTWALIHVNLQLYSSVPETTHYQEQQAQFVYLKAALREGAAEEMQARFPEGYFFTYVLYGLSWVNVGLVENLDPTVRQTALFEARQAYGRLSEPAGKQPFAQDQVPPYGIFYQGWRNYLLSGILLLQQPGLLQARELAEFKANCEAIANALAASPSPFLPSYPRETWPVDTFPALVSLRAHRSLIDESYEPTIAAWLARLKAAQPGSATQIDHRIAPFRQGPRGTSQALIQRFLPELDPVWAAQSYGRFRQEFVTQRLGIPGILEYPIADPGKSSTKPATANPAGDIDSGPLITGVSLSATAIALGTAKLNGDDRLHRALWQASELVGLPTGGKLGDRPQKRYWFGLLPITDAFLLWSQTATPWFSDPAQPVALDYPRWWRWPSHGISLALWMGILWGVSDRRKARQQRRRALKQRRC